MALATEGKLQEAIAHFSLALQLKPDYAKAHHSFGIVLAHQGHHREAIDHFREAIKHKPDFVQAQDSLRTALEKERQVNVTPNNKADF
jgi:tetratricopeptide (TPR) repeat protein